jgi:hypothetical protein
MNFLFNLVRLTVVNSFNYVKTLLIDLKFENNQYILDNLHNFDESLYNKMSFSLQAEHQIARVLGMKKVNEDLLKSNIVPVIVEFGVWRGLSLKLMAIIFARKIPLTLIGLDSFQGLPTSSTIWTKGQFSDVDFNEVKHDLLNFASSNTNTHFELINIYFHNPELIKMIDSIDKNSNVFHIDCDLGTSLKDILNSMINHRLSQGAKVLYLLFDDWGMEQTEIPDAFWNWYVGKIKNNLEIELIYTSKNVRYLKLIIND